MTWRETISKAGRNAGQYLIDNSHAQQAIPSQHRLLAASGMFVGWWALDKIRDIVFGMNQISEGEFEEVKKEDVPLPLRFLHKTIDWNPHSDDPNEQWKKLAHQMLPAIGAGFGTMAGSMGAFEMNGRAQKFADSKHLKSLSFMDAEWLSQYAQAKPLRMLTAFTGGFSAASMMPLVYGAFLNLSFASANGARIFSGNFANGAAGPAKALDAKLGTLPTFIKDAVDHNGKINDAWAKGFVEKVLTPLFGKDLKTHEAQVEVRHKLQKIFKDTFDKYKGLNPEELPKIKKLMEEKKVTDVSQLRLSEKQIHEAFIDAVSSDMKKIFGNNKQGFEVSLEKLGLKVENAKLGNANPTIRAFNEFLVKVGIRDKSASAESFAERVTNHRKNAATSAAIGAPVMGGV